MKRSPSLVVLQPMLAVAVALLAGGCSKEGGTAATAPSDPAPIPVHVVRVEPRSVPISFDLVGQVEGSKRYASPAGATARDRRDF